MDHHARSFSILRSVTADLHTTALLAASTFALAASGCCMSASVPEPRGPPPPAAPPPAGARAGGAPTPAAGPGTPGCPDLTTSIVGTWSTEGLVEEYRADGVYVINGVAGTYRFLSPGHAVLDEPSGGLHGEYELGLSDASTLIAIGANHIAMTYTRTSPAPVIPANCFDLTGSFPRTWLPRGGGTPELYSADGSYTVGGSGRWSFTAPGRLLLTRSDGVTSDYVVAMPSPTMMLAVRAGQGVAYDAQ